jgi:putative tryptophan/tyrosine transport system substrate-binding protein
VILTATSAGIAACKAATSTIPIVFATAASPVEQGFVASLRRPGGNVTGVLSTDVGAKIIELAREALPKAQRLAILVHESDPVHKLTLNVALPAAKRFKFETLVVRVKGPEELARAFSESAGWKADAIYLPQQAFASSNARRIGELSREVRLPLFSAHEEVAAAGGLVSYGHSREEVTGGRRHWSTRSCAALPRGSCRWSSPNECSSSSTSRRRRTSE